MRTSLNTQGYIFLADQRSIDSMTYGEYLREYGADEVTTRHGIAPRMEIREKEGIYQLWDWGINGSNPTFTGATFTTEQDAGIALYECFEHYIQEKNWNAPRFFETYDEAVAEMAELLERSEDVIRRYLAFQKLTANRLQQEKAQSDARQAVLAVEAEKEAESIAVDNDFIKAMQWVNEAKGSVKSDRLVSAVKALLERNGKEKVNSDFWRVARMLKKKADTLIKV